MQIYRLYLISILLIFICFLAKLDKNEEQSALHRLTEPLETKISYYFKDNVSSGNNYLQLPFFAKLENHEEMPINDFLSLYEKNKELGFFIVLPINSGRNNDYTLSFIENLKTNPYWNCSSPSEKTCEALYKAQELLVEEVVLLDEKKKAYFNCKVSECFSKYEAVKKANFKSLTSGYVQLKIQSKGNEYELIGNKPISTLIKYPSSGFYKIQYEDIYNRHKEYTLHDRYPKSHLLMWKHEINVDNDLKRIKAFLNNNRKGLADELNVKDLQGLILHSPKKDDKVDFSGVIAGLKFSVSVISFYLPIIFICLSLVVSLKLTFLRSKLSRGFDVEDSISAFHFDKNSRFMNVVTFFMYTLLLPSLLIINMFMSPSDSIDLLRFIASFFIEKTELPSGFFDEWRSAPLFLCLILLPFLLGYLNWKLNSNIITLDNEMNVES